MSLSSSGSRISTNRTRTDEKTTKKRLSNTLLGKIPTLKMEETNKNTHMLTPNVIEIMRTNMIKCLIGNGPVSKANIIRYLKARVPFEVNRSHVTKVLIASQLDEDIVCIKGDADDMNGLWIVSTIEKDVLERPIRNVPCFVCPVRDRCVPSKTISIKDRLDRLDNAHKFETVVSAETCQYFDYIFKTDITQFKFIVEVDKQNK